MIKLRLFLALGLFTVLLASACSPTGMEARAEPSVTVTPLVEVSSPTLEVAVQPSVELTATPPAEILPLATSRGPNLEATDPTTVSLASGQLHFVEFFRFT